MGMHQFKLAKNVLCWQLEVGGLRKCGLPSQSSGLLGQEESHGIEDVEHNKMEATTRRKLIEGGETPQ